VWHRAIPGVPTSLNIPVQALGRARAVLALKHRPRPSPAPISLSKHPCTVSRSRVPALPSAAIRWTLPARSKPCFEPLPCARSGRSRAPPFSPLVCLPGCTSLCPRPTACSGPLAGRALHVAHPSALIWQAKIYRLPRAVPGFGVWSILHTGRQGRSPWSAMERQQDRAVAGSGRMDVDSKRVAA